MYEEKDKIFIISGYAPPSNSGSGLMMYNILSQFPDDLLVILTSDNDQKPELQKYKLKAKYYYYGNNILSLKFNESIETNLQKIKRFIKNFPLTKFIAQTILLIYLPWKITKLGISIVKNEKIKYILGYSDFGPNLFATYLISKLTKKPFYLHFYDMYQGNKMPVLFKLLSIWLEPKLFLHAEKIFVMCDKLKEYYDKKYKVTTVIIYNSIFINKEKINIDKYLSNDNLNIFYLGSIYWAQKDAVLNLVNIINKIENLPIKLTLYTPHSEKYLNSLGIYKNKKINFSYCLPENVQSEFSKADLLFLGLSFDKKYSNLINTSSPGKLCDYLISNRPILIHSPKNSFLTEYAKKNKFAYIADEYDLKKLKDKLTFIYHKRDNKKEIKELTTNALNIAFMNHDAIKNGTKFLQKIK